MEINGTVEFPFENPIRAITLWQPWASLLMAGLKTYETRSWHPPETGWMAIHAAKTEPKEVQNWIDKRMLQYGIGVIGSSFDELPRGAVIGLALFNGYLPVEKVRLYNVETDRAFGDWSDGRYAWRVSSLWPFENPIPTSGRQRLWRWEMPADLLSTFRAWWLDLPEC